MEHEGRSTVPPALAAGAEVAFVCDARGSILQASETIGRLLGRSAGSMRGRSLAHLAVREDRNAIAGGLAQARLAGASSFSARLRTQGGVPVEKEIAAWCVESKGKRLTLCFAASSADAARRAEERARYLADTHKVIATILALALEEIPLDELLGKTLDLILSIPWLAIERKGAIFLVEQEPKALVMKVNRGLIDTLLTSCARVPFGQCMCGLAAASGKAEYSSMLDERHSTRYPGIVQHGHYCVPICSEDQTLGMITTYLAPGHERSDVEIEFLTSVANTLAGVLIRRREIAERHRAEVASRAKSEFLALVSHELLTPVTAVMLSCERLERDRASPLASRHAQILWRMEGALSRLASTIRLLLEHARLDSAGPSVRLEAVDLAELAARVVEEVRPMAQKKGLTVRFALEEPLPPVRTDERLLKVVLANLASNAVKFTTEGWVAMKVGYRDGAHRVAVEDTGPGIPEGERARIFEPFEPLEPLSKKHMPGMGLGLALAYRLATALGARLELEPAHGPGSTFVVTLPETAGAKTARELH
jgi:signal transduction histidine kinase